MKNIKTAVLGIASGFLNGLFGAGGGSIIVPGMQKFLNIEQHKAHATAMAVMLPLTLVSAAVYLKMAAAEWAVILWVSLGGAAGGFIGARLLNKIPAKLLHKIFGAFMIAASLRMIFRG